MSSQVSLVISKFTSLSSVNVCCRQTSSILLGLSFNPFDQWPSPVIVQTRSSTVLIVLKLATNPQGIKQFEMKPSQGPPFYARDDGLLCKNSSVKHVPLDWQRKEGPICPSCDGPQRSSQAEGPMTSATIVDGNRADRRPHKDFQRFGACQISETVSLSNSADYGNSDDVISLTEDDEPKSKQAKLDSSLLHKECLCDDFCFGRRSKERILVKFLDFVKPLLLSNAVLANWVQQGQLSFELVVIDPILAFDLSGSHQLGEEA
ncbi:hypothetical protein WA026_003999 [Henosepilachna vigintioctopunctata]|uniref:Uncharacterized protein n=1 Tax=Henosepilachna vigintioctopunctata TaxID=420089 RepID=A0AAW1UDT7_9CUCU